MHRARHIQAITLAGFQGFNRPTRIPLERLTLLFGPNSAGKSAIRDALDIVSSICAGAQSADSLENGYLMKLMERHWRNSGSGIGLASSMEIAIESSTPVAIASHLLSQLNRDSAKSYYDDPIVYDVKSSWIFRSDQDSDGNRFIITNFELQLQSQMILQYEELDEHRLTVNLNHSVFLDFNLAFDFEAAVLAHPEILSSFEGNLTIKNIFGFDSGRKGFQENDNKWLTLVRTPKDDEMHIGGYLETPAAISLVIRKLALIIGELLSVTTWSADSFSDCVDASRHVPSKEDLTFYFGVHDSPFQSKLEGGDARYRKLAKSIAADVLPDDTFSFFVGDHRKGLSSLVNQALSNDLFLDRGYRIDFDYNVILSSAQFQEALLGNDFQREKLQYVVEIFLRDSHGIRHELRDVGTGLGYVLPVLCAILNPDIETCVVQQPELHLHPALQSAVADVFIQASIGDKQLIVETHSEYFLLRLLKRIRQKSSAMPIATELDLDAEDLCVLYFNPLPDGTTEVRHLRVSEDGDFIDRWPRGFFSERDLELFDE